MGKITFILGGARSGKSQLAIKLAKEKAKKVAFIATCLPRDREMKKRIALHKKIRPKSWKTFEEPEDLNLLLKQISSKFEVIIIDCLTLLVSNLLLKGIKASTIENKINKIVLALKALESQSIIVSNEVGLGIVPENKLARAFRDIAGRVNQIVANKSSEMFFMVSGIPLRIK
jgi:adenosylcobinamide kinase/adenosylcobinamide-phosphate guanylyltransferase